MNAIKKTYKFESIQILSMDKEQFREILIVLEKKVPFLIWISCIDKERNLTELSNMWGIKSPLLYGKIDNKTYCKKLEELNLIKTRGEDPGRGAKIWVYSKMDWLAEYIHYLAENQVMTSLSCVSEDIMPIYDMKISDILEILNSNIFRKGCMNLNFLIDEIASAKSFFELQEMIFNKLTVWDTSRSHSISSKLENKTENTPKLSEELIEKLKKEPYKHKAEMYWELIICNRLHILSVFKSFKDDRCLEYFKSPNEPISLFHQIGSSQNKVTEIHNFVKKKRYAIPEKIEPLFTMESEMDYKIEELKYIKKKWHDVWKEVLKELNLKEK